MQRKQKKTVLRTSKRLLRNTTGIIY